MRISRSVPWAVSQKPLLLPRTLAQAHRHICLNSDAQSVPYPSFVELLAQDTTADLLSSPNNCSDFLTAMRASLCFPPRARNCYYLGAGA